MKVSCVAVLLAVVAVVAASSPSSPEGQKSVVVPSSTHQTYPVPNPIPNLLPEPGPDYQSGIEYVSSFARSAFAPKSTSTAIPSSFSVYQPYQQLQRQYNVGPYQQYFASPAGYPAAYPAAYSSLPTAYSSLPTAYSSLPSAYSSQPTAYSSQPAAGGAPYPTPYSSQPAAGGAPYPTPYSAYAYGAQPAHHRGGSLAYSPYQAGPFQPYSGQFAAPYGTGQYSAVVPTVTPYSAAPSSVYQHQSFYSPSGPSQQYAQSQQYPQSPQYPSSAPPSSSSYNPNAVPAAAYPAVKVSTAAEKK